MSHFPRVPVRFIESQQELLKSQEVLSGGSASHPIDYRHTADVMTTEMGPTYNAPHGRANGNQLFRRYANGELDMKGAKHVVVDIIHKVKDQGPLTELEKLVLTCLFPTVFAFVDPRLIGPLSRVQLKLLPVEVEMIRQSVAGHFADEQNWNAGRGGGAVPNSVPTRV